MAARSIRISLDETLLAEVDRQQETRALGRSAVVRRALRLYLDLGNRRDIDDAYARAYAGRARGNDRFAAVVRDVEPRAACKALEIALGCE